jgi:acetyl-CoA/propionyl-CoA carboxylase biotin carboxyl carrier protein
MAHPDFTSPDAFKVHTRWIETDFANTLVGVVRAESQVSDAPLVRTAIEIDGRRLALGLPGELLRGLQAASSGGAAVAVQAPADVDAGAVVAPITGTLQSWKVADGATVAEGELIATMEAMKMEMQIVAQCPGRISLEAEQGAYVAAGAAIAAIAEIR